MPTKIPIWVPIIAAAASVIAIIKYFEEKPHREAAKRIAHLDEEIKKLELAKLKESANF